MPVCLFVFGISCKSAIVMTIYPLKALFAFLALSTAVQAQTLQIEGPDAFAQALRDAPSGATLALAPGDYGHLRIRGDLAATTIRSADPSNPARFSSADVRDVDDMLFEGLYFDYEFNPEHRLQARNFVWRNVTNTVFRDNIFDGDRARGISAVDDGYGYTMGFSVAGGADVVIEGNEIFDFWKGLHVRGVDGLVVRGNDVHTIRMDGMNFVQVSDVLIEGNHIHNFNRSVDSRDHADMIQFWTARTEWSSHDVVIRGNVLNSGTGWFTQSIFIRNERSDRQGSVDPSIFYRNFVIEENVIINAHTHGITVGDTIGLRIARNTVVQNPSSATGDPGRPLHIPQIRIASINRDVEISNNIVYRIVGQEDQGDWTVTDNLMVQNQERLSPNHYTTVFQGGDLRSFDAFRYLTETAAGHGLYGSGLLR